MSRVELTKCRRRLRNALRFENSWLLIKSRITLVFTVVHHQRIVLGVEIFGGFYVTHGSTFNKSAIGFLEEFYKDYTRYAMFQGTKISSTNDAAIVARMLHMADKQGALSTIHGANFKLSTLSKVCDDEEVKRLVEETVDEMGYRDVYDTYIRTDEIQDPKLHADGLLVHFSEEGNKPYCLDSDDVIDMILDSWLHEEPFTSETFVSSMDPVELAKIKVENTSAGNFSASPVKKPMCAIETAGVVAMQAQTGLARTAPSKPAQKLEVIKKLNAKGEPKKVRAIQVDSADNALAAEAILGSYVRLSRGLEGGSAIGVPTNKGFGMRLFRQVTRPLGDDLSAVALEARRRGAHESDMSAWEATTKPETAMAYCILVLTVASLAKAGAVAANLLANYYHPFFSISGDQVCSKPGKVSSGSKPTASGNTKRHRFMIQTFKMYVRRHTNRMGIAGCVCAKCKLMCTHPDFGKRLPALELALLLCAVLMGDDFFCLWNGASAFYDRFCDLVFGTVHKTERLELEQGAFLKRRLKNVGGWWTTWVPTEIAIPKFRGPGAMNADNKMCACINVAVNSNNKEVYDFCFALYKKLEKQFGRSAAVDEALMDDYKGTYECDGFPTWEMCSTKHLPTPWDLMMIAANHASVMATNLPVGVTLSEQK